MYLKRAFRSNCAHAAITELRSKNLGKVDFKARISEIFGVDVEDTDVAIRRVVAVMCLNEYFVYVFGKKIVEAKAKDLADLRENRVRYENWRAKSKKVSFDVIQTSIDFVSNNLK